jgi:hypothetical protein
MPVTLRITTLKEWTSGAGKAADAGILLKGVFKRVMIIRSEIISYYYPGGIQVITAYSGQRHHNNSSSSLKI